MQHDTTKGSTVASRIAGLVGEAATRLRIRESPDEVAADVSRLIGDPVRLYEEHPIWPSLLTDTGLPVELSLKVGTNCDPAIRCVVDVADHGATAAVNWSRYLLYAARVAGPSEAETDMLRALCRRHLDGIPDSFPAKMIHGVGYAADDWYRGSLYFRMRWLGGDQLAGRFPTETAALARVAREHGAPVDGPIEVLGYDFLPDHPPRWKAYSWADASPAAPFHALVGRHPDLEPAREVFEAFRGSLHAAHHRALLLQTSASGETVRQRLFFFGSSWGWGSPSALEHLLTLLDDRLEIDTAMLGSVADAATARALDVPITMLAVGTEAGGTSATFYFWPREARRPVRKRTPQTQVEAMIRSGAEYLLLMRDPDGLWRDYREAGSDVAVSEAFVTAYTAAMLAAHEEPRAELQTTFRRLLEARRPGSGCVGIDDPLADPEIAALGMLASARAGPRTPPQTTTFADEQTAPDVKATLLLSLVESGSEDDGEIAAAVLGLSTSQRPDGGWSCVRWDDDLVTVWLVARALRLGRLTSSDRLDESVRAAALKTGKGVGEFVSARAIARESFRLGLWLGAAANVGRPDLGQRIVRAVAALEELQQPDGSWPAAPNRRLNGSSALGPCADACSIVTTATVVGSLSELSHR